ncbi:MAG: hypothetical protein ACRDQA_12485 [Nocardioidaceae bacterium]
MAVGAAWFIMAGTVVAILILNQLTPYQPFAVRKAVITHTGHPVMVCPRDKVKVMITRKFTDRFEGLDLTETWVNADTDKPAGSATGTLPPPALNPSKDFGTVPSPLLRHAPSSPGRYYVRIAAVSHGHRYGLPGLEASGTYTFRTANTLTVANCEEQ